jgi:hypothetical protein
MIELCRDQHPIRFVYAHPNAARPQAANRIRKIIHPERDGEQPIALLG